MLLLLKSNIIRGNDSLFKQYTATKYLFLFLLKYLNMERRHVKEKHEEQDHVDERKHVHVAVHGDKHRQQRRNGEGDDDHYSEKHRQERRHISTTDHYHTKAHQIRQGHVVKNKDEYFDVTPSPSRPSTANSISRRRGRDNRIYQKSPRNMRLRTPPRPLTANPKTSWQDRLSSPRPRTVYDVPHGRPFGNALPKNRNVNKHLTGSLKSRGYRDRVNYGRPSHPSYRHRRDSGGHKATPVKVVRAIARNPSPAHRLQFTQTAPGGRKNPFGNKNSSTCVDQIGQSPIVKTRRQEQEQNDRRLSTASSTSRRGRLLKQRQMQHEMRMMNQTIGARPSTSIGGNTEHRRSVLRSKAVGDMINKLEESVKNNWKLVLPALEQLSFNDPNARLEALEALIPNLEPKELNNMDHWVVNNRHRVQTLQKIVQDSLQSNKPPEMEAIKSGKITKEGYRPRAFTEYWDEAPPVATGGELGHSNNIRRPRTAGPSMDEKLFPGHDRKQDIKFNHAEVQITTPSKIFQQLKEKSEARGRASLKRTSVTSRTVVPQRNSPAYINETHRLKTTNRSRLKGTMRPIYKYIHPDELGHDNQFTRMRNYRKFNNGLYETQRRRQHQYKSPNLQPKFMTNTVNYDQGLSRNLYGR